ncbi:HAD-like protein, partial [Aureobasidium melanogenum]
MAPVSFSFEQLLGYLILWISIIQWLRWLTLEQKIKEILFDCDNTLVLSEHLAFEACAELANEILEKHGKSDRYTGPQLLKEFVGQNFRGMMVSLQKKYGFEIPEAEFNQYVDRELGKVVETLEKKAEPCDGATEVLEKLFKSKKYGLAVVSSSALSRVQASIRKVGQDKFFPAEHV